MLNNFIYAQTKDLFLEALGTGNILDEAIVFIEDTKEIWNHGTYFAGESIDPNAFAQLQTLVTEMQETLNDEIDGRLITLESYFSTVPDADETINKWIEIVDFLKNVKEGNDVGTLLASKANQDALDRANIALSDLTVKVNSHIDDSWVSKSGETLTVRINGTSQSLTNTWRDVSDAINSTSSTTGASSKAVKTAYDLANTANTAAVNAQNTANGKWTYNASTIAGVKVNNASAADTATQTGQWVNSAASTNLDNISNIHGWANGSGAATNLPSSVSAGTVISFNNNSSALQLFAGYKDTHTLYYRKKYNGAWGAWRTIIDSSNIGSYSVSGGNSVDQTARDSAEAALGTAGQALTTANNAVTTANNAASTATAAQSAVNGKWTWNASEIAGVKVNNATNADKVGGFTVECNVPANAKFTDNDNNVLQTASTTSGEYPLLASATTAVSNKTTGSIFNAYVTLNPNTRTLQVGSASSSTYYGKVQAGNGFFQTSDERLKNFGEDIKIDFDVLKSIPKKYFTWKDDEEKKSNIGTSAQVIQKIYPELVSDSNDGTLVVDYNKLSVIALKAVDELHAENQELKDRLTKLEEIIYGDRT